VRVLDVSSTENSRLGGAGGGVPPRGGRGVVGWGPPPPWVLVPERFYERGGGC